MPTYTFKCKECGYKFSGQFPFKEYEGKTVECPRCKHIGLRRVYKLPTILGGFTRGTPAGYFRHEKTGRMIPVDKKGNVMESDPYYSKGDPRGWKRAGKSTRGYERTVHLDERGDALEEKKHE